MIFLTFLVFPFFTISLSEPINKHSNFREINGYLQINSNETSIGNDIKVGDFLHCDVQEVDFQNVLEENKVEITKKSNIFKYYDTFISRDQCISFAVKANREITIALADSTKEEVYEIFLGLGEKDNFYSKIRHLPIGSKYYDSQNYETRNILNEFFYQYFWLSWNKNQIKIGYFHKSDPIMEMNATNLFQVEYIGLRGAQSDVEWTILEPKCPQNMNKKNKILTKCYEIQKGKISVENRLQRILLQQMVLDFENFKNMSESRKTASFLERFLTDLEENYSKAKEYNEKILTNNLLDERELQNYIDDEIFIKIKEIFFQHFYLLQNYENQKIDSGTPTPITPIHYSKYEYIFKPPLEHGIIYFNITIDDDKNIDIKLLLDNEERIEISIGNLNSSISVFNANNKLTDLNIIQTANFMDIQKNYSQNDFGFWLQLNVNKTILIGRKGESKEFLQHSMTKTFTIVLLEISNYSTINGFNLRYD